MTTTLIYEPIAHISDDYFQPLKISGAAQPTVKSVAKHDDSVNVRTFRAGDTVRCQYNDETCVIIWTREDWLWLDPVEYNWRNAVHGPRPRLLAGHAGSFMRRDRIV
jgi:hypothetical protein